MIKKLLNSKFKKDLIFSYFTQGVTIGFGFLQLFLINRYFGVETYGQLAIVMSTAGIFSALLTARSSEAITRFFTREMINKNFQNAKFVLLIGFCIDIITAFLMLGLTYLFSDFIAKTFIKDISFSLDVFLYSFVVFFGFLRGTLLGYFQSKEMFFFINSVNVVESLIKATLLLIIIFVLQDSSLYEIIATLITASILSYIYVLIVFLKNYIKEFKNISTKYNKAILKEYWSFNIKTFTSSSLKAGNSNIDNLLIAYFINAHMVGIYQIIKKILSPIGNFTSPFSMLVYPKLVNYFETQQKEKFKEIIFRISFYIGLFCLAYCLIFFFAFEYIFEIMKVEFFESYNIVYLLFALFTFISSMLWWVRIFSNTVNPNYSLYMNIFATIFQLTITVFMTYLFEIKGLLVSMIIMNTIVGFYMITKINIYNSTINRCFK